MQPQCAHHMTTHAKLARSMNHIARATKQTAACTCAVTTMVIWSMQADVLACQCMACGNHRILTLLVQVTQQQSHTARCRSAHTSVAVPVLFAYIHCQQTCCVYWTHRHTQRQTNKQTHTDTHRDRQTNRHTHRHDTHTTDNIHIVN